MVQYRQIVSHHRNHRNIHTIKAYVYGGDGDGGGTYCSNIFTKKGGK